MKIHNIEIKNFKGFEDIHFPLNGHFTVFIGENATGKTTVLDALAVALGSAFVDLPGLSTRSIKEEEIRVVDIDGQPRPQKPVMISTTGTVFSKKIRWSRELTNLKTTSKNTNTISSLFRANVDKTNKGEKIILPVIAYHTTGRLWYEHEKIGFQKQKLGVDMAYTNCLSVKASPKEFLEWFKTQEDSVIKFNREQDKQHLMAFKQVLLDIIPETRLENIAFDRKSEELVGVFTDNQGDKHHLTYRQFSDGFRNIISLAADIAYRCIQLNPHLGVHAVTQTPGVVLIDELDLHLHPNWQRRVVSDLKRVFPNIQFVATTHSPFIVQSLNKDELVNLDNSAQNEGLESSPSNYGIEDVAEIEMGVDDVARSEAFKERVATAAKYYQLIAAGKNSKNDAEVAQLRQQLNDMEKRFSDDPAFVATLQLEKNAANL